MTAALDWDDDDFISQSLIRGQGGTPLLTPCRPLGRCRWCDHAEHGFPCGGSCTCESTYSSRDDSWRPADFCWGSDDIRKRRLCDRYGLDGYAARAVSLPGRVPQRLKALLESPPDASILTAQQGILT